MEGGGGMQALPCSIIQTFKEIFPMLVNNKPMVLSFFCRFKQILLGSVR